MSEIVDNDRSGITTGDQGPSPAAPTPTTAIEKLDAICNEIYDRWDTDMRSGKLLSALAGRLPATYRAECADIRRALGAHEDLLAALRELLFDAFEDVHPDSVKKARAAIAKATGVPV